MRAREIGLTFGTLATGPANAITDVAGVRVGHVSVVEGEAMRTGVTAILPHDANPFTRKSVATAHVINGFGKSVGLPQVVELGQLESPILLTNTLNVWRVADAVIDWLIERNAAEGVVARSINPVVGECNDSYLNDILGRHVGREHVLAALASAGTEVAEGVVGAGVGMTCYGYKGGIGTASRRLPAELGSWTLGALVLANFGRPGDLVVDGLPIGRLLGPPGAAPRPGSSQAGGGGAGGATRPGGDAQAGSEIPAGSIMIILATDAPVDSRQLGRIAHRVPVGLGRTGSYLSHGSGDFVIAFSTANPMATTWSVGDAGAPPRDAVRTVQTLAEESAALDTLFRATAEAVEEAVVNALFAAEAVVGRDGHRREALPVERVREIVQRRGDL